MPSIPFGISALRPTLLWYNSVDPHPESNRSIISIANSDRRKKAAGDIEQLENSHNTFVQDASIIYQESIYKLGNFFISIHIHATPRNTMVSQLWYLLNIGAFITSKIKLQL